VSTLSGENLSLNLERTGVKIVICLTFLRSHRDKEWLRPKLIVARSLGSSPSSNEPSCSRIPRNKSLLPRLSGFDTVCTLILSFLDIERAMKNNAPLLHQEIYGRLGYQGIPNLLSATKRDCLPLPFSTISSDKNFFKPLPILPSWIAVISSTAFAVDVNRCRARSFNLQVPKHQPRTKRQKKT